MRTFFAIVAFLWTCTLIAARYELTPPEAGPPGYFTGIIGGATDGTTFLTVWGTRHDGLLDLYTVVTDAKGARITERHQPIFTGLVTASGVAHVGNQYVVGVAMGSDDIRLLFLDSDGALIRITDRIATGWMSSIAATDDRILLTYMMPPVYFGAPATVVLDAKGRSTGAFIPPHAPGIAARRGDGFVVASSDYRGTYLQRFDVNGRQEGDTIVISQSCCVSSVASNGDHTLVITSTYAGPAAATLVAADGSVVGYRVLVDHPAQSARVVWHEDRYVIAVGESDSSGSPAAVTTYTFVPPSDLGARTVLAEAPATIGALVATESTLFAATSTPFDVVAKTWTPGSDVQSTIVSDMPSRQIEPVMVSDGVDFLTVWREVSGTRFRLRASSTRSGSVFDIAEDDRFLAYNVGSHAVAYGNGQYLIVWRSGQRLLARRVDRNAAPIDAAPLLVRAESNAGDPAVAWNGSYFFVVAGTPSGLASSFIAPDGAVYSGSTIAPDFSWTAPSLVWNGSRFLLAYDHIYAGTVLTHLPVPSQVVVLQLNANGQIVGERAIVEEQGWAWAPRLATSGSEFLVSYSTLNGVRAAIAHPGNSLRVERSSTLLEWRFPLPSTAVAWNGSEYVVAYTYDVPTPATPSWFVGTARVDREGTVLGRTYQPTGSVECWFSYVDAYPRDPRIAIAAASGDTRIALAEFRPAGSARITIYSPAELLPAPAPPAPPQAVSAWQFSSSNSVLTWTDVSNDEEGFVLSYSEGLEPANFVGFAANAVSGTTELTLFYGGASLSAWNPGGFSRGTLVTVVPAGRRRPAR